MTGTPTLHAGHRVRASRRPSFPFINRNNARVSEGSPIEVQQLAERDSRPIIPLAKFVVFMHAPEKTRAGRGCDAAINAVQTDDTVFCRSPQNSVFTRRGRGLRQPDRRHDRRLPSGPTR